MGDVLVGCVVEIKSGNRFLAVRDEGLQATVPVHLSATTDLRRLFWTYGSAAGPRGRRWRCSAT